MSFLSQNAARFFKPAAEATTAAAPSPQPQGAASLRKGLEVLVVGVLVALILFALQVPHLHGDIAALAFFVTLNCVAASMPISIYKGTYVTASLVLTVPLIAIYGGPGAVIAAPLQALAGAIGLMQPWADAEKRPPLVALRSMVWTAATTIIVLSASAFVYDLIAEGSQPTVRTAIGCAGITVTWYVVYVVMLSGWRAASGRGSFREVIGQHFWIIPHCVAMGVMGFVLIAAYDSLGLLGAIAFVIPAITLRFAMKQYIDKTAESVTELRAEKAALQQANIEVRRMRDELATSYDDTLEALVNALDARDQETKGHSIRVSKYMLDIARAMGVKEGTQDWIDMQRGSLLHDVGKIGVTDTILLKPGKLTAEEWQIMQLHPEIGYNMLRQVKFLQGAAELILTHHERWDGKGYPQALREEEIPLGARIFSVVDTFDSMTSDRPYRKALTTLEALNEIMRHSGSQFDPVVVEAFLDIYETWVLAREELHKDDDVRRAA